MKTLFEFSAQENGGLLGVRWEGGAFANHLYERQN